jgi:hypothetical protein
VGWSVWMEGELQWGQVVDEGREWSDGAMM